MANKNRLCMPVPFPKGLEGYATATQVNMMNQFQWSQDKALRQWLRGSRLDAFGRMVAELDKSDEPKQATLTRLRNNGMAAMVNLPSLAQAPH